MFTTLLAALALSAPVPKAAPKLVGVFGEPTAAKGDCSLELSKQGDLTITVPPTHPRADDSLAGRLQPLVAKTIRGDFVLTVRLKFDIPEDAASAGKLALCAGCGVAVRSDAKPELGLTAVVERWQGRKGWNTGRRISGCEHTPTGALAPHNWTPGGETGAESYLKLTRQGAKLTAEWSDDGVKWQDGYVWTIKGLEDAVAVGPVAYQSTDKPITATFEEYQFKLVEKEGSK